MAKLNLRISTTGSEFEANDLDFTQVTPQQILDNMRGNLPDAGQGKGWKMLKGGQVVDQDVSLDKLGFKDGDTADLMAKVEGA